ncbi:hypothetical protein [Sulfurospirillum barnesii]|uniref:Excinuclease ABC subunit A n=1 Tax=Sulfurospirillum barnesii (strain ATCC 700032 / DSM 10660 / SES-3) TaxID=760154 RepID=I3XVD0_SULBS|nr:hypothetical protein [Sulfurospirillum barnesii]AFL67904.1 hypothetical protein Sulba_0595 [Sulfurospirillum barnesii SES-3]
MRIFLAIIALCTWISAANLLTYNVYERTDRVDVMLSFDAPHEGSITQKSDANTIVLTINDLSYDKMIEKSINSLILQDLTIVPEKNNTLQILLKSDKKISVIASKTVDGFGLRIRSSLMQNATQAQSSEATSSTASLPTDASTSMDLIDSRYIIVITILFILILLMLWVKRRVNLQNNPKSVHSNRSSWLFNQKTASTHEVTLLHKKPIDTQNSVVLFEYGSIKYLVMTGSSNLLLEKFQNGEVKDDTDFEKVFEENRRRLDEYLKLQDNTKQSSYKEKASADYAPYDEAR